MVCGIELSMGQVWATRNLLFIVRLNGVAIRGSGGDFPVSGQMSFIDHHGERRVTFTPNGFYYGQPCEQDLMVYLGRNISTEYAYQLLRLLRKPDVSPING